MAFEVPLHRPSIGLAAADLSGYQFRLVKVTGANAINICTAGTDYSIGVLQNKPISGQPCEIETAGTSKCVAGAPVTAGQPIMPDGSGRGIPATTTNSVHGIALEDAAAAGELFTVNLRTFGLI